MAFEKEKADIKKRLSDLQKEEFIYLACVVVKDQEQEPETGRIYYPVVPHHLGALPHPKVLRLVQERLKAINEVMVKQANEQGWRIK